MAGQAPLISIGLPVYNGEKYLEETLKCLLSQTYEDFTLIISDNASTDKTREICQTYAAQDNRIKYFCNEKNIGSARNFNHVFSLSKSKYFKWAACDDLIDQKFLSVCIEILDNEPDVILSYPKTTLIDAEGEVIGTYEDGLNLVCQSPQGRFLQVFHNIWLVNPLFGVIRSEALKKTNLLESYPDSDLVFLAELSLLGQFREAPHYLLYRRLHSSSVGGASLVGKKVIASKTDQEKSEYYGPDKKGKVASKKKRLLLEYLKMIKRSPIPIKSKILLFSYLIWSAAIFFPNKYFKKIKKM